MSAIGYLHDVEMHSARSKLRRGHEYGCVSRYVAPFAIALALMGFGCGRPTRNERLPERMRVEEILTNLSATFDRTTVVNEPPGHPVHIGRLQPRRLRQERQAIVAPAPSHVRFHARIDGAAALRFGVALAPGGSELGGAVRFNVDIDGHQVFTRTIDPAAPNRDRGWVDGVVDLEAWRGLAVDIDLRTEAVGGDHTRAGLPGWSHVRIVREAFREREPASSTAPSVLVLLVDTLRADRLGCYGANPSPSPTLDGLVRDGLLFEQVVAQAPWTLPSVATLFTGLHPRSHGMIGGWTVHDPDTPASEARDPTYLSDALPTLAAAAQAAGITTVGISANLLVSRGTNLARGFETFVEFGWADSRGRARNINRLFLNWLNDNRDRRFLGYLHYIDPHGPYQAPQKYRPPPLAGLRPEVQRGNVGKIRRLLDDGGPPLTGAELAHLRALYDAEIRYWDAQLAVLLEGLAALGVSDTTVLVITSDHGEEFLEHQRLGHGAQLYDEQLRVPLIISGPGIKPGRAAGQVQGIDFFPTVAALLGVRPPPGLPGRNALVAGGERPAVSETRWGLASDGGSTDLVSVRTPSGKLIHAPARDRFEFYDLASDPDEREDRFERTREATALKRELARWEATVAPPPPVTGRDVGFRDKLRALGYIE